MLTPTAFLFFLTLLLIAYLLGPLAEKIHMPFSIILVMLGFIGSELVTKVFGLDTGINWENFHTIIFYLILPILIFQEAIEIDVKALLADIALIMLLALPLMLISAAVTAAGVYYGIAHPSGFPWIAALLTGALLSATDPAAVLSLLKKSNAPKRLCMLLEGESLFNDATAIVLFSILIGLAMSVDQTATWNNAIIRFLSVFCGGLAVGAMVGIIAHFIIKVAKGENILVLVTIICAYTSFIVAEDFLHFSGIMAVLSAGLIIGSLNNELHKSGKFVDKFWEFIASIAEALIFLLAGVTITLSMFTDQWLAISIGVAAVLVSRIVVIFGTVPLLNWVPGLAPVPIKHQIVLTWGGVRGTVTLALALSLPLSLSYWYTIQSIAYGVVLFTLFVQTTTMNPLMKKLNLDASL
jgi:monovalent cation:H+ antiporter, CPA1 family